MRYASTLLFSLMLATACDTTTETTADTPEKDDSAKPDSAKPDSATEEAKAEKAPQKPDVASAFTEYQRKSMRAEALVNTRQIADGLRSALVADSKAPQSIPVTPAPGSCCKKDKGQCEPTDGAWEDDAWKALSFNPGAHRYSYQVDVDGSKVTVTATADLDCDGTVSTFSLEGNVSDGDIEFNTDKPVETNPLG